MRLRINGPHAIVVEIAARMASRDGRSPSDCRNFRNTDLPPRSRTAFSIASGRGSSASAAVAEKSARVLSSDLDAADNRTSRPRASSRPEWANRSISARAQASVRSTRFGPMIASGRRHDGVRGVAGFARRLGRNERRIADQIDLGGDSDVEHGAVVLARDLVHQRKREIGFERQQRKIEHRYGHARW